MKFNFWSKIKKNKEKNKDNGIQVVTETAEEIAKAHEEVIEEITEEVTEEVAEDISEEVAEEVVEEITEEVTEEVAEDISEEVAEEVVEEITEEVTEEVVEDISEEVAEEVVEEITEEVTEEVAEDISEEVAEEVVEGITEEVTEEVAEDISEEVAEEVVEEITEEVAEEVAEDISEEVAEKVAEETAEESKEKGGFFARLKNSIAKTKNAITEKIDGVFQSFSSIDDDLYDELEEVLIMADIGANTAAFILDELKAKAREEKIKEPAELKEALKEIISNILKGTNNEMNLSGSPAVIVVIGVNGVGKTTSIGKMAAMYKAQGKKVILAAADTFRAAAIDQLEIWAERAGVDIVKHMEGSDPSSVVFDAIASAKAKGADLVICDTAGRLHNKKPLMEELKKVARVVERESGNADFESLLVLDGSTGQNALIQAKEFAQVSRITGVILTKLDGTAKGGVIIPLAKEQNIGVKFIGIGEQIDDLRPFDPVQFAQALFSEE